MKQEPRIENSEMDVATEFEWVKVTPVSRGNYRPHLERFGCTTSLIGHYIWVIGGFSYQGSYTKLDIRKQLWTSVNPTKEDAFILRLHSANLYDDMILIFGVSVGGDFRSRRLNDFVVFDPILNEVKLWPTFGEGGKPEYRDQHTVNICEQEGLLVMFGGLPCRNELQQLYLLDLYSRTWSVPESKGKPPSFRRKHGSCMVGSRLFVYSGFPSTNEVAKLYTVRVHRARSLVWQEVNLLGSSAMERLGAGFKYVGSGRMFVFGGFCNLKTTKDLYVIENIASNQPSVHKVDATFRRSLKRYSYLGDAPAAREGPRLVHTSNKLIVLGGSYQDGASYFELAAVRS